MSQERRGAGLREVDVNVSGERQSVLRTVCLKGDATKQADPVEHNARAREDKQKGEEG